jgi:hypothetical protein
MVGGLVFEYGKAGWAIGGWLMAVVAAAVMFASSGSESGSSGSVPTTYSPSPFRTDKLKNPTFAFPTSGSGYGYTVCKDGWVSRSSGRGTCSHHGGVR